MLSKLAFIFPGQGSQFVGMLAELAEQYPMILDVFATASASAGYDIWQLTQTGPESLLNQTEKTQVAMLTADVAIFKLLRQVGIALPQYMAGHSLGEYAALVCAGAINFTDAVNLVIKRGRLMQQFVPLGQGGMAAIVGLPSKLVEEICEKVSQNNCQVTPANYNAIGQTVIAGHLDAIAKALDQAKLMHAHLAKIIPVSVPCHCPLLADAAQAFTEELNTTTFYLPQVNVISNVNLSIYNSLSQIRHLLTAHLIQPVRWVETIQFIKKQDIDYMIECGPGKILHGLNKRIDKTLTTLNVNTPQELHTMQGNYEKIY